MSAADLVPAGDEHAVRHADPDDVEHDREPDPRVAEAPRLIAQEHEQDAEDGNRVDELLAHVRNGDVRFEHGPALGTRSLLDLRGVHAVQVHRSEADDGRHDVQHQHGLVEVAFKSHDWILASRPHRGG